MDEVSLRKVDDACYAQVRMFIAVLRGEKASTLMELFSFVKRLPAILYIHFVNCSHSRQRER